MKILVVDDENMTRELITTLLKKEGYGYKLKKI